MVVSSKGLIKECYRTTMSLDANNDYCPLAYGVVEQDDFQNWAYFFRALRICIDGADLSKLKFISDRYKGLIKGMVEIFTESRRRICNVHYNRNFSKDYPGMQTSMHLIACARHTFDPELKCPDNTTNFVESFNGKIEKYRSSQSSHCWKLLEGSLCKQLSRISKDWKGKVVPRVKMLLVKAEKESRAFRLTPTGREIFEVLKGPTHFTVGLNTHYYDCMDHLLLKSKEAGLKLEGGRSLLEASPSNATSANSLVITKGATERMGKDRPSYKEKRGKRKVGRPSKEGPPAKKSKIAHRLSSSRAASQPSSSKKSARPSSSKIFGQPSSSNKSTVPCSFEKAPAAGSSMPTRQPRSSMQGSQLGISQTPTS
ncbi:LOW QUALITY PROTEIN: hypothetical protein Cgig2_016078 [Carnegiea gigantea]|uniref:MULE transposase domain-containing protein n=1 Tax=Carnegiea gigantea TaxID=171969 RepID=A0A9Q1GNK2_9CARY|nr:LOW QUALITY PROTEIN: hypothetical protein Cgig2_016078 [Carnegiea gigantea]